MRAVAVRQAPATPEQQQSPPPLPLPACADRPPSVAAVAAAPLSGIPNEAGEPCGPLPNVPPLAPAIGAVTTGFAHRAMSTPMLSNLSSLVRPSPMRLFSCGGRLGLSSSPRPESLPVPFLLAVRPQQQRRRFLDATNSSGSLSQGGNTSDVSDRSPPESPTTAAAAAAAPRGGSSKGLGQHGCKAGYLTPTGKGMRPVASSLQTDVIGSLTSSSGLLNRGCSGAARFQRHAAATAAPPVAQQMHQQQVVQRPGSVGVESPSSSSPVPSASVANFAPDGRPARAAPFFQLSNPIDPPAPCQSDAHHREDARSSLLELALAGRVHSGGAAAGRGVGSGSRRSGGGAEDAGREQRATRAAHLPPASAVPTGVPPHFVLASGTMCGGGVSGTRAQGVSGFLPQSAQELTEPHKVSESELIARSDAPASVGSGGGGVSCSDSTMSLVECGGAERPSAKESGAGSPAVCADPMAARSVTDGSGRGSSDSACSGGSGAAASHHCSVLGKSHVTHSSASDLHSAQAGTTPLGGRGRSSSDGKLAHSRGGGEPPDGSPAEAASQSGQGGMLSAIMRRLGMGGGSSGALSVDGSDDGGAAVGDALACEAQPLPPPQQAQQEAAEREPSTKAAD